MFDRLGTKLLMSTAYHPQTDGQLERTNQTVEIALRYYLAKYPDLELEYILPQLQFTLNQSTSVSTDKAPNELLYGFLPREASNLEHRLTGIDLAKDREVHRYEAEDSITFA